jgi:hypothetical protein
MACPNDPNPPRVVWPASDDDPPADELPEDESLL